MAVYNDKDKLLILEFKRQELVYEISNLGYIIRDSSKRETPDEGRNIADIEATGNVDRISRLLDLAYADVLRILSAFVDHKVETDAYGNDIQQDPDSYFVMITLKHNMPGTTENLLRIYIHEFMVDKVMGEWLLTVAPDKATTWLEKSQAMETNIKGAMSARKSFSQIKPSVWG